MEDVVIRAEGLGKKYSIGHQVTRERYTALRDVVSRNVSALLRTGADLLKGRPIVDGDEIEEFWALRDVDFEVRRGEAVGIIGRNGAGKSTLLKVLSRITEPSAGRVAITGRVASLLEVGTGFHPELTGRQNIFLNGAIMGMSRAEIRRKFDEIVSFSEVEKFLDTPVKRFSSGMYMRLAFAIAAHLNPEILVVDEVLAVGDAEFQKRCLNKMSTVAKEGRTVLFVSHNIDAIRQLTSRCILLRNGMVAAEGSTPKVVEAYRAAAQSEQQTVYDVAAQPRKYGMGTCRILRVNLAKPAAEFKSGETISFSLQYVAYQEIRSVRVGVTVYRADGTPLTSAFSASVPGIAADTMDTLDIDLLSLNLAPGEYYMGVGIGQGSHLVGIVDYDVVLDILHFRIGELESPDGTVGVWAPGWGSVIHNGIGLSRSPNISSPPSTSVTARTSRVSP